MLSWDERFAGRELGLQNILLVVGAVWALHAIANLVRVSTTIDAPEHKKQHDVSVDLVASEGWGTTRLLQSIEEPSQRPARDRHAER